MKKYYAAENFYGSDTSIGFTNTWYVLAFSSRKDRDAWVEKRGTLSARAIPRQDVTSYPDKKPRPFSGEFWGINNLLLWVEEIPGCLGYVETCRPDQDDVERFYAV